MNNKNTLPNEFYLPCMIILIGIISGILFFSFTPQPQFRFYYNFQVGSIILSLLIMILHKRKIILLILSFLLGMNSNFNQNHIKIKEIDILEKISDQEIKLCAKILPYPKYRLGSYYYSLGNITISNQSKNFKIKSFKFRFKGDIKLKMNEVINITCMINRESLSINSDIQLSKVKIQKVNYPSSPILKISNSISMVILNSTKKIEDHSSRAIIKSLLTGNRSELSDTQKNVFRKTGMYHLLALSGLHVLILSSFIHLLLKPLPIFPLYKNFIIIIIIWLFYFSTGAPPTLFRASFAITIFLLSQFFQRRSNSKNALGAAGSTWLISNPLDLYTASFQLSFLASYIILESLPILNSLSRKINNKILCSINTIIVSPTIISTVLLISTIPIFLYHFGSFSIGAIFLNIPSLVLVNVSLYTFLVGTLLPDFLFGELFVNISSITMHFLFNMLYFISHRINLEFQFSPLSNTTIFSLIVVFGSIKILPRLLIFDKGVILLILLCFNYSISIFKNKSQQHIVFQNEKKKQLIVNTSGKTTIAIYDLLESKDYRSTVFLNTWRRYVKKREIDFLIVNEFRSAEDLQEFCKKVKVERVIILKKLGYYEELQLDYFIQCKNIKRFNGYNQKLNIINNKSGESIFISNSAVKIISSQDKGIENKYLFDLSCPKEASSSEYTTIKIEKFRSDTCLIRI